MISKILQCRLIIIVGTLISISYLQNNRPALKTPALRTLVLEIPALMGIDLKNFQIYSFIYHGLILLLINFLTNYNLFQYFIALKNVLVNWYYSFELKFHQMEMKDNRGNEFGVRTLSIKSPNLYPPRKLLHFQYLN